MTLNCIDVQHAKEYVPLIASWYEREWGFELDKMEADLNAFSGNIPFQLLVFKDDKPVATGGVYYHVNLLTAEPRFQQYGPWLALVYTLPEYRGQGIGSYLCEQIEKELYRRGEDQYYLYTSTAESLYLRMGWGELERLRKGNREIVVMTKKVRREDQEAS